MVTGAIIDDLLSLQLNQEKESESSGSLIKIDTEERIEEPA